jgi:predicted DNA-binding transcriptional regulator YafY
VVDPVRLAGGYLTAFDHRLEEVHTFAVHRITGVAELDDDPGDNVSPHSSGRSVPDPEGIA